MPFKPGESGNPKGRPKRINEAARKAREHTDKAIAVLVQALHSDKEENRLKAAEQILNRGWGKPQEFLEVSGDEESPLIIGRNVAQEVLAHVPTEVLERLANEPTEPSDNA